MVLRSRGLARNSASREVKNPSATAEAFCGVDSAAWIEFKGPMGLAVARLHHRLRGAALLGAWNFYVRHLFGFVRPETSSQQTTKDALDRDVKNCDTSWNFPLQSGSRRRSAMNPRPPFQTPQIRTSPSPASSSPARRRCWQSPDTRSNTFRS